MDLLEEEAVDDVAEPLEFGAEVVCFKVGLDFPTRANGLV